MSHRTARRTTSLLLILSLILSLFLSLDMTAKAEEIADSGDPPPPDVFSFWSVADAKPGFIESPKLLYWNNAFSPEFRFLSLSRADSVLAPAQEWTDLDPVFAFAIPDFATIAEVDIPTLLSGVSTGGDYYFKFVDYSPPGETVCYTPLSVTKEADSPVKNNRLLA